MKAAAKVVDAPPKRADVVDMAALNRRIEVLEAQLATARAALVDARTFIAHPTRWRGHYGLAAKRRLDLALAMSEPLEPLSGV